MRGRLRAELAPLLGVLVRRERLVAAALVAAGVLAALQVLSPAPPAATAVLALARDVPAGSTLGPDDLAVVRLPEAVVPTRALRSAAEAAGEVLAAPGNRGEVLTRTRLLGRALVEGLRPGTLAVAVRVADPGAAALLRTGDHVDALVAAADASAPARAVASDLPVVTVPAAPDGGWRQDGALVVLAASATAAGELASASASGRLALVARARR